MTYLRLSQLELLQRGCDNSSPCPSADLQRVGASLRDVLDHLAANRPIPPLGGKTGMIGRLVRTVRRSPSLESQLKGVLRLFSKLPGLGWFADFCRKIAREARPPYPCSG